MSANATIQPREPRPLPQAQHLALARARRLCWWSLLWMGAVSAVMYFAMGGSQAMRAAFVEDLLGLLPPAAFLVASRFAARPVDAEYINGRSRAFDINFLIAGAALAGVGLILVWDALHTLLAATHPVIGTLRIGDHVIWQGWAMMAAMATSAVPPAILGRKKLALARELSLKPLRTDADMGKADWMTALAGLAGVAGIGFGLWWMDAAAALFIAASVLRDGAGNLRNAVRDLHDARPQKLDRTDPDPLVDAVRAAVAALDWVEDCQVRFHEEGLRLSGIVFVRTADGLASTRQLRQAHDAARAAHWRIDEVIVTLAGKEAEAPPRA